MPLLHRVMPGECMSAIGFRYGFHPDTLWQLSENAALRERRASMYQLVAGEDSVFIPDLRPRSVRAATGKRHVFRRLAVPEKLRVRLLDTAGAPRAGLAYKLVAGTRTYEGTTSADGELEHYVGNDELFGTLTLYTEPVEVFRLRIGKLLPLADARGVQQRLRNLGHYHGDIDGSLEAAAAAIAAFQKSAGLDATGTLDDATSSALDRAFGGA